MVRFRSNILFWISWFFLLLIKMSRILSSSPLDISHFLAICARAPENYFKLSLSLWLLLSRVWRSEVTLGFPIKAWIRRSQISAKFFQRILTFENFCEKTFLQSLRSASESIDWIFLSASSIRIPLIFLDSNLNLAFLESFLLRFLLIDPFLPSLISFEVFL